MGWDGTMFRAPIKYAIATCQSASSLNAGDYRINKTECEPSKSLFAWCERASKFEVSPFIRCKITDT